MNKILYFFVLFAISFTTITACTPAIKHTALMPARFHNASLLKEVAVLPFEGKQGREFATEIEGALASINIGDKQYFTVVDRVKLDKIINELKFSQSGLVDESKAAQLGKMVGAKGIYTGIINRSESVDNPYREERSVCAQRELKRDRRGNLVEGSCIRWNNYTVNCTERRAIFEFTPKLIEVETGRVVYSKTITQTKSAKGCSDSSLPIPSSFELIGNAKELAKADFKKDVAPYYITMEIKLMDSTDGITAKEAEKKFEQGLDFAKHQRMDRACELWGEARIISPNSPSILYNLGLCSEITGDPEKALDLYKKADKLMTKPDDKLTAALKRVGTQVEKQKLLKEQMDSLKTSQQASANIRQESESIQQKYAKQIKDVSIYLIVLKSTKLRSDANTKSKTIKNLKKGEKIEKLMESGNWIKVKLLSGETGWVHKSMVKEEKR